MPAARARTPAGFEIAVARELGGLPLYDQDIDTPTPPTALLAALARKIEAAALHCTGQDERGEDGVAGPPPHGRPEKRKAITSAARAVFGREGYTRAGVDAIAAEAGVSKRTIYNHFADKEQLFLAVALEGAHEVTAAIEQIMDRHLRKIVDLEQDLVDFSLDRIAAVTTFPDHFALVRTIEAEATRIPPDILKAWIDAGPQTGHLRLAPYLRRIADRGLLTFGDADRAAAHLTLLTVTDVNQQTFYGAIPLPQDEIDRIVTSGVRAFLRVYATSR